MFYLSLLTLLFLTPSVKSASDCTEQWSEIDISKEKWTVVGDAQLIEEEDGSKTMEFERTDKDASGEIGGAIWNSYDFSHKRGLKISFSPQIKVDSSYFGNLKYPNGFAVVFTSSSLDENLIGKKGEGNGYEEIMNAVAFEFDFVKHSSKNDPKYPHFCINYNITGPVSATAPSVLGGELCNIELMNFYDSSNEEYKKNIIFEIEIVGKKVSVKTNQGTLIDQKDLGAFQELLDQEGVHVGVTASMVQEKKVTISNFKVSEVSTKEKGELILRSATSNFAAGNPVSLYYKISSTCGESLKIYTSEYTSDDFQLIINDEMQTPDSKVFDSTNTEIKMTITEKKVGTYTALVKFKDSYSAPTQFEITEGSVQRYEICDDKVDKDYNIITTGMAQEKDSFIVEVCSYDQFKNVKLIQGNPQTTTKVFYSNGIVIEGIEEIENSDDRKKFTIKVPIGTFGPYQIYNPDFMDNPIRTYNLIPASISPEKSIAEILYGMNVIPSGTQGTATLRIQLKDNYGRIIPKYEFEKLNCDFMSYSEIEGGSVVAVKEKGDLDDDNVFLVSDKVTNSGKYVFVPKIKCDGFPLIQLKCQEDETTQESLCAFFKEGGSTSKHLFKIYSDFLDKYISYEEDLLISLDEDTDKLTDIILLDDDGKEIYAPSTTISASLDESITISPFGNKFGFHLPSGTTRKDFNPNNKYSLSITIGGSQRKINVRFYYLDPLMSNINLKLGSETLSYLAFYKQNSKTIKASSNLLLFDLFEYYEGKSLGEGKNLDVTKVRLTVDDKDYTTTIDGVKIIKYGPFISITTNALQKAGTHIVSLRYNNQEVVSGMEIIVEANEELLEFLGDKNGNQISDSTIYINSGEYRHFTLLDKYENQIKDNHLFEVFTRIKIITDSTSEGFIKLSPSFDGRFIVTNTGRSREKVTLEFPNKKQFIIQSLVDSTFDDVDPSFSYGLLTTSDSSGSKNIFPPSIIYVGTNVKMTLFLKDGFNNLIDVPVDSNKINVYLKNKNDKEIQKMVTSEKYSGIKGFDFTGIAYHEGDYEIKIFINDIPVECRACNFKANVKRVESKNIWTNIQLYLLGSKMKIPVMTDINKPAFISKSKNLIFLLQFIDDSGTPRVVSKSSLYLSNEDKSKRVGLCAYGNSDEEKNIYKVCSDQEKTYQALTEGIYSIEVDALKFYFYLVETNIDSKDYTPVLKNSFILLYQTKVYGKTDLPGSFIVDLRNSKQLRINSIDPSKVTLTGSENVQAKTVLGPEPGLMTVFLIGDTPGTYKNLEVNYDGNKIIEETVTYVCGCGSIKTLKLESVTTISDGHYAVFEAQDFAGNLCKSTYSWNEFDDFKNFGNVLIKAVSETNSNKVYKMKTFFNHLSGKVILAFDLHISGNVELSSSYLSFDGSSNKISIANKVIDKDHFYTKLDTTNSKLKVDILNYNYEKVSTINDLDASNFQLVLLRQINDDFKLIKNDFTMNEEDFSFNIDFNSLDAVGQYIFVTYYKGQELFCENCFYNNAKSQIDPTKTKVYHKEGNGIYIENDGKVFRGLYKTNFPFFKVNLYSTNGYLVKLSEIGSFLSISLKDGSGNSFAINSILGSDGNIYVSLKNDDARHQYLELTPMTYLTLTVSGNSWKYLIMNGYPKKEENYEKCTQGGEISIINSVANSFIVRANELLEIELTISGCWTEQQSIITDSSSFKLTLDNGETAQIKSIIPTDLYGGYILLFSIEKSFTTPSKAYITYKENAVSENFMISVLPGYRISGISIGKDESLPEPNSNKQFAYFHVDLMDEKINKITNIGRNLFLNDLYGVTVKDSNGNFLPYKFSYDDQAKKIKCQFPINGNGKVTVATTIGSSSSSLEINIAPTKFSENNIIDFSQSSDINKYTFKINLVDNFYKSFSSTTSKDKVIIKYFTINPVTEEIFEQQIAEFASDSTNNEVTIPDYYPKYQYYGFIPILGFNEQICYTCLYENTMTSYVYSVHGAELETHDMTKEQSLIKNVEYPVYLYRAQESIAVSSTSDNSYNINLYTELIKGEGLNVYAFNYQNNQALIFAKIEVKGTSQTFTLTINFADYSYNELPHGDVPTYTEKYGKITYSHYSGSQKNITFFIEVRDSNKKLISTIPTLYLDNLSKAGFKKINVFPTLYNGIFYIVIAPSKKTNIAYTIQYKENDESIDKSQQTIFIDSKSSFPTAMVLINKQEIDSDIVQYDVIATNANSEEICDERLNIYTDNKQKLLQKKIYYEGDSCKLLLQFTGDIALKSNIGGGEFVSDLSNNNNSLYSINQHYSSLSLSPNVFSLTGDDVLISITFKEKSTSNIAFDKNEITVNKKLFVFKYYSPTKYELVSEFNGLYSSQYSFYSQKLSLTKGNSYVLVGTIVNNNIAPKFIRYDYQNNDTPSKFNLVQITENHLNKKITNISDGKSSSNGLEISVPFSFELEILNSMENKLEVDLGDTNNEQIEAKIILSKIDMSSANEKEIPLIVRQFNNKKILIEINKENIEEIIHLPIIVDLQYYYYLEISYTKNSLKTTYYTYLNLKTINHQNPNENIKYHYYGKALSESGNAFKIGQTATTISIPSGTDVIQHICLFDGDKVINENLSKDKVTLSPPSGCTVTFDNSYIGCIDVALQCSSTSSSLPLTTNYNSNSPSSIYISVFPSNDLTFDLKSDTEVEVASGQSLPITISAKSGSSDIKNIDINFFKVYSNGEKLSSKELSISTSNAGFNLNLPTQKTIPSEKQIMVIYDNNLGTKIQVLPKPVKVTVNQPTYAYDSDSRTFSYRAQVPVDIKVGEEIYFYLLIQDSYHACYYGDASTLSEIYATITFTKQKTSSSSEIIPVERQGISQCKYIYKLSFNDPYSVSGDYEITIYDGDNKINMNGKTTIHIQEGEIDPKKSTLSGATNVKAGERFELTFKGTDSYDNALDYYDIINYFDIEIWTKNTEQPEKIDFEKKISVSNNNDKLILAMTIDKYGTYQIKLVYKGKYLEISTQSISVSYGECSITDPQPIFLAIDGRQDEFYSGETVTITIQCKDTLGNAITSRGNEIFLATIKLPEKNYNVPYDKVFKQEKYFFTFSPSEIGTYSVTITLNGKNYGPALSFAIKDYDYDQYMCMDKRQFTDITKCNTENYRKLIKEVLGEDNICPDPITEGKVFKCPFITEEEGEEVKCVAHTKDCECNGKSYNGFCYNENVDPFGLVEENQNKVTCLSKLKAKYPGEEFVQCPDGSCRKTQKECETNFECPIGFKSCANKCILISADCKLTNECLENEVLCWDLSCTSSYDLCPTRITCPEGKVLCPDGSCQAEGHCMQPSKRTCNSGEYQCPDFSCVKDKSDCKKNTICPIGQSLCEDNSCQESCQNVKPPTGKYRCANGDYVDSLQLCPTDMFCPSDHVKCPNGACATSIESCDFIQGNFKMACPANKPILCPDFECVDSANKCNSNIPTCPPHKPYQCWNNECRTSLELCPTPYSCPPESPVYCSNGLCAKSINGCTDKTMEKCSDYRCFDGTCVKSIELCPTHTYCGKDAVKCWNGACASDISECPDSQLNECPENLPYRCPDGSCRPEQNSCSTMSVCPSHLPIKCFDSSCRAHINECPPYQNCGTRISCPDGTCAASRDECNTVVTCYTDKPFLCYDGSCKKQISECPDPPKCGKNEVLCPNGSCMSNRQNCKVFDPCEASTPIRCEMNTCTNLFSRCSNMQKRCPIGYITCANGECRTSEFLCEYFECPKNKPYKCDEGICVHDKSLCDNPANGCPYNFPYKCPDGSCVESESKCNKAFKCSENLKQCPDGSCINKEEECPLSNGCYADRPFKCADGTCINKETTSCSPMLCSVDYPIKCPNGHCASKLSECPTDLRPEDIADCQKDGMIMCENGRCVTSSDYCRPTLTCDTGYTACADGTCRVSSTLCPANVLCPAGRPYRCGNGICAKDEEHCSESALCPEGYTTCSTNGACIISNQDCPATPKLKNGCPYASQVKCSNGRCLNSLEECLTSSNACSNDTKPFLCPNGECTDDLSKCDKTKKCEKDLCDNGKCVSNDLKKKRMLCSNDIACPLYKPYRCSNGECVISSKKCTVTSISSYGQLISNLACDSSKPYLCDDHTCVSDYTFCKTSMPCDGGRTKCENGYCVKDSQECSLYADFCPATNPIKCPTGTCVKNIIECSGEKKLDCQDGEFYCTRLAKCVKSKLECLIYYDNIAKVKQDSNNRRLFEIDSHHHSLISFVDEPGTEPQPETEPDPEEDNLEEEPTGTICFDGTLATEGEKCPVVPACKVGQFRCENGGCAYDKKNCLVEEDYICLDGEMKCPDGMCHTNCNNVAFHGCLVGQYQCSNGMCVEDEYDCIGYSMCPDPEMPYRCLNSDCKASPFDCPVIERLGEVKNIIYSYNKLNKVSFSFAFDPNSRTSGKMEIPGSALNIPTNYSQLYISEVSSSILYESHLYNNTPVILFNVSNSIKGSEGILNFENSVMSPVIKFYSKDKNIKFILNGTITLSHNSYGPSSSFIYSDYCLAKLKGYDLDKDKLVGEKADQRWECVEFQTEDDQEEFKLSGFGVYAVILSPQRNLRKSEGEEGDWWDILSKYLVTFLYILGGTVIVLGILIYIYMRISRYREKYHENRQKILLLQQQREEYENMTTDVFGQTLGDNIIGLVYKANPAYLASEENKGKGNTLEEEIENLQVQCKNVENQNNRLQEKIDEMNEKYKILTNQVENMAK